jgi:heptosyltransferase-2
VRVGILKPDHLGDLILAAPAIANLQRRFRSLTLFCQPKNLPLAAHLFPGLRARPMDLPHLDKERRGDPHPKARLEMLRREVDLLICLRWDGQIERLLTIPEVEYHARDPADLETHVAVEHRLLLSPFTGPYDILESYIYPHCPPLEMRPTQLRAVALCISAGFHLNAWPLFHWLGLAERLYRGGTEVVLLGGPSEVTRLHMLAGALEDGVGYRPRTIVGGSDFGAVLQEIHQCVDLVVATDSGTAHLAALVRPVVSLFGGSPWRRFAPLGRFNAILCRRYPCSPCQQFNRATVNTCYTQECLANLSPDQVYICLRAYLEGCDFSGGMQLNGVWMTQAPWSDTKAVAA